MKYIASANCSLLIFPVCLVSSRALGETWDAITHHRCACLIPCAFPTYQAIPEHGLHISLVLMSTYSRLVTSQQYRSEGLAYTTEAPGLRKDPAPSIHFQLTVRVKAFLVHLIHGTVEAWLPH